MPLDTAIWPVDAPAATTPQAQFGSLPATAWSRHVLGDGTNGRRIADAVVQRVRAQRDGQPGPEVWLILRRDPETGEQKAFLSNAPTSVTPTRLVALSGMRWPIEQIFEVAKQQLGMGDYKVRWWTGWHHHMTLVILAHFFLVRLQRRLKKVAVLSLEQVCLLLSVMLPLPRRRLEDVLDQIASYQRRHAAARTSHHCRTERRAPS